MPKSFKVYSIWEEKFDGLDIVNIDTSVPNEEIVKGNRRDKIHYLCKAPNGDSLYAMPIYYNGVLTSIAIFECNIFKTYLPLHIVMSPRVHVSPALWETIKLLLERVEGIYKSNLSESLKVDCMGNMRENIFSKIKVYYERK